MCYYCLPVPGIKQHDNIIRRPIIDYNTIIYALSNRARKWRKRIRLTIYIYIYIYICIYIYIYIYVAAFRLAQIVGPYMHSMAGLYTGYFERWLKALCTVQVWCMTHDIQGAVTSRHRFYRLIMSIFARAARNGYRSRMSRRPYFRETLILK